MDSVNYFFAKNGEYSLKIRDMLIHSAYNPSLEALNFLKGFIAKNYESGQTILIIGSGLGYLEDILSKYYSYIEFISYDFFNYENVVYSKKHVFDKVDLHSIRLVLERLVSDESYFIYTLLIWPPVRKFYTLIINAVEEYFDRMRASFHTVNHFSWKWLVNGFRNFLLWDKQLHIPSAVRVCVISCGFSLEEVIPYLLKVHTSYFIVAVSSVVYTLRSYGIDPDLVVNTDGGYYAKRHLSYAKDLNIVNASFGAVSPYGSSLLSLGSFFDSWIDGLGFKLPRAYWAGTVAASAISIAVQITSNEVILIGQDLSVIKGFTHARPHYIYENIRSDSNRLHSYLTRYYLLEQHSKETLNLYASWFRSQEWNKKIKQLCPSKVDLGITATTLSVFGQKNSAISKKVYYSQVLDYKERNYLLKKLWHQWFKNPLNSPLVSFLCGDKWRDVFLLKKSKKDYHVIKDKEEEISEDILIKLKELYRYIN